MQQPMIQHRMSTHSINADLPDLLTRIYGSRGIQNSNEITYKLKLLHHYQTLKQIDKAADLIANAITKKQTILIIGDFDCDGATSTALAVRAIRSMNGKVNYLLPNRFEFGYGLTPEIVELASNFSPDLLITVDNGIANHEGVKKAKQAGYQVVITDHHLPADTLPIADAIVNPSQPNCEFPSKNIAGVGVIFYVICAVRKLLEQQQWLQDKAFNPFELLDLVALGTVADVVPLDHNNRILVQQGLARIQSGHCCLGIKALSDIARKELHHIEASDLGFILAPRLNAAGRLDDMSIGVELLLTNDSTTANQLAYQLHQLNEERKQIEASMQQEAMQELENIRIETSKTWGICLYQSNWHQGVIGILASRVKERWHRPVIVFAETDNEELKGSARSIPHLNIRDLLDNIAKKNPSLIKKFGGHAMAAGLIINKQHLPLFKKAFNKHVHQALSKEALQETIYSDGAISEKDFTLETALKLQKAGPWGQNFPEPQFDGIFSIVQQKLLAKKHLKLQLQLSNGNYIDAIAFNIDTKLWPNKKITTAHLVYQLSINYFQNQSRLQLKINHIFPAKQSG